VGLHISTPLLRAAVARPCSCLDHTQGRQLKQEFWWRNVKVKMAIFTTVFLVVAVVIVVLACFKGVWEMKAWVLGARSQTLHLWPSWAALLASSRPLSTCMPWAVAAAVVAVGPDGGRGPVARRFMSAALDTGTCMPLPIHIQVPTAASPRRSSKTHSQDTSL
jgi:hypothetical protein